MPNYFEKSFEALSSVLLDGAFSARALNASFDDNTKKEDKALITNIFYGVIENNDYLEKTVKSYLNAKPKPKILLTLKIGLYLIKFLDKIPLYAAVDNAVNFSKKLNAGNYTSLVNAVMRKMCVLREEIKEIETVLPEWFLSKLKSYYDENTIKAICSTQKKKTHIRLNENLISDIVFTNKMKKLGVSYFASEQGGYFVENVDCVKDLFDKGMVTFQSPSSIVVAKAFGKNLNGLLLDVCAAPGGKSAYLAEKNKNLSVTACDIYPHRTKLISYYVKRMKVDNVDVLLSDATKFNKDFEGKFDFLLCDAPCSGTGTFKRKPDVFLNKKEEDIDSLFQLQYSILNNVFSYLKKGGIFVYSTCSLLDDENDFVIEKFLKSNDVEFISLNVEINEKDKVNKRYGTQILPVDGYDGFYVSCFKKK